MKREELEALRAKVSCEAVLERAGYEIDLKESTRRAVKYRRGKRYTVAQILCQFEQFGIGQTFDVFLLTRGVVNLFDEFTQLFDFRLLFHHLVNAPAQPFGRPTQMYLENLTNVHTRWYAQRVQYDVHRRAIGHVRHVLYRYDQ